MFNTDPVDANLFLYHNLMPFCGKLSLLYENEMNEQKSSEKILRRKNNLREWSVCARVCHAGLDVILEQSRLDENAGAIKRKC